MDGSAFGFSCDTGGFFVLRKSVVQILGWNATALLQYLCNSLDPAKGGLLQGTLVWWKQDLCACRWHTTLSSPDLRDARQRL